MKQLHLFVFGLTKPGFFLRITSGLIIFFITVTTQAQTLIPELSFRNPVLKTGEGGRGEGLDGAVYVFENVGWDIDALVTILGRSSDLVVLSSPDIHGSGLDAANGTGEEDAWQPSIRYGDGNAPAHQTWWMEFKISFVKHGDHQQSVGVSQFFVSGLDIDGDGSQLHEFQTYYKIHSFSLEGQTAIYASSIQGSETDPLLSGKRFDGSVKDYPGISMTAEDAMVSNFYTGSSSMIVRLGAETGSNGSKAADRKYGLLFGSLTSDIPTPQEPDIQLLVTYRDHKGSEVK